MDFKPIKLKRPNRIKNHHFPIGDHVEACSAYARGRAKRLLAACAKNRRNQEDGLIAGIKGRT